MSTRAVLVTAVLAGLCLFSCAAPPAPVEEPPAPAPAERLSNIPPLEPDNIVSLAIASKDHATLVQALRAADYVTAAAASGPLTVFAPTDAAFDALPPGTLENLMKPESADQLREVLKYHVTTSALPTSSFKDGQVIAMANGAKATIRVQDGKYTINGANIIASVKASNGMLHVIDAVLIPPAG